MLKRARFGLIVLMAVVASSAWAQKDSNPSTQELFDSVNRERKAANLPSLKWDTRLADAAGKHADAMAQHDVISHQVPGEESLSSRVKAAGVFFSWLSENVDAGESAVAVHAQFMKSKAHRANILDNEMDSVGIGVTEKNGRLFVTEDFAKVRR
jgi:uncharacterized protein YkwD